MKIRGLLAGLVVVVAISGCNGSPTAPKTPSVAPAALDEAPPPDTTTTANRGGGTMGTGT
jgi:hypothetical protein